MKDFARMFRRSGYSKRFGHEVVSDAVRGYEKRDEEERSGGRPIDRLRANEEEERRRRKEEKRERFYQKEKRGSRVREGVFIISTTPNGLLAKEIEKISRS